MIIVNRHNASSIASVINP